MGPVHKPPEVINRRFFCSIKQLSPPLVMLSDHTQVVGLKTILEFKDRNRRLRNCSLVWVSLHKRMWNLHPLQMKLITFAFQHFIVHWLLTFLPLFNCFLRPEPASVGLEMDGRPGCCWWAGRISCQSPAHTDGATRAALLFDQRRGRRHTARISPAR